MDESMGHVVDEVDFTLEVGGRRSNLPRTEPEFRAQRLGYALHRLAADLVQERHKAAALRREVAELRARLKAVREPPPANEIATPK